MRRGTAFRGEKRPSRLECNLEGYVRGSLRTHRQKRVAVSGICLSLVMDCKDPKPSGYLPVSYGATTHHWTILFTEYYGSRTRRLTTVCLRSSVKGQDAVVGPDACNLKIGQRLVMNLNAGPGFLNVYDIDGRLSVLEGPSVSMRSQDFKIIKDELVSE
jgi:hypothetical protein